MKTRIKFKLRQGDVNHDIDQTGDELQLHITGTGPRTYIWIGSNICFGTIDGMKTLETLAASIYKALGHEPMWLHSDKIKALKNKRHK